MPKRSPRSPSTQLPAEPEVRAAGYWWIRVVGGEWEPAEWTGAKWWGIAMQRPFGADEVAEVGAALPPPAAQAPREPQAVSTSPLMLIYHEPGSSPRIGHTLGDEVQSVRRWQESAKPAAALYVVQASAPLPSPGTAWVDTAEEFLARDAALSEGPDDEGPEEDTQ